MQEDPSFNDTLITTTSSQDLSDRRGARWVWWIGGIQGVLCGWMVLSLTTAATMSPEDFAALSKPQVPAEHLALIHPMLWPLALSTCVLGFLPGLAYIYLGFGVRKGRTLPARISIGLSVIQAILLGVFLVSSIVSAILEAAPAKLTLSVLVLGTPLIVMIYCTRALLRTRLVQTFAAETDVDPWH